MQLCGHPELPGAGAGGRKVHPAPLCRGVRDGRVPQPLHPRGGRSDLQRPAARRLRGNRTNFYSMRLILYKNKMFL